tara:strand:- start:50 stop:814 length:765 start_codon:yes stop_codon:yes gene_type:complete
MKYLLSFILLLSFLLSAQEEEQFDQCIYSAEEQESSAAMFACFEKFEIENTGDCINHIKINYGKTEEQASKLCFDITVNFDFYQYLEDRPAGDFFDLLDLNPKDFVIKSYACSVPKNKDGLDAYNSVVRVYDGNPLVEGSKVTEEDWYIQKAIIHIAENIDYAEVNFGETIYPVTDYRFFTNVYREIENILVGVVDEAEDMEYAGGTDKGGYGIGWKINKSENDLTIFMDNLEIYFIADCGWSDINIDELEKID